MSNEKGKSGSGGLARYQVAISYPREHRGLALALRRNLLAHGLTVYLDTAYQDRDLGKGLDEVLEDVYSRQSDTVVAVVSSLYLQKDWTRFELDCAVRAKLAGHARLIVILADEAALDELPEEIRGDINVRLADIPIEERSQFASKFADSLSDHVESSTDPGPLFRWQSRLARFAQPRTAALGIALTLTLWVTCGIADTVRPSGAALPWLRDWMGHWLIFFSLWLLFFLQYSYRSIGGFATPDIWLEAEDRHSQRFMAWTLGSFAVFLAFALVNAAYVYSMGPAAHWSPKLGGLWLPLTVALTYYLATIWPLVLFTRRYAAYLDVVARRCTEISEFSIHLPSFGLRSLGRYIAYPAMAGMLMIFPAVIIQRYTHEEPSVGNVASVLIAAYLLWRIAIAPVQRIAAELAREKAARKKRLKDRLKAVAEQGELAADDAGSQRALRNGLRDELREIDALDTFPISRLALLIPAGIVGISLLLVVL